jgi:hypothetical protein
VTSGGVKHYHDCRPAIRGDAAIVAPVVGKAMPPFLQSTWNNAEAAFARSSTWIVIGYSLPEYDVLVRELLRRAYRPGLRVYVCDPAPHVADRYQSLLSDAEILRQPGLPDATAAIRSAVVQFARDARDH